MIIPREFSGFFPEQSLLVITGKHYAKIFRTRRGMLELLEEFKVESPVYSDKEVFFLNSTARENIEVTAEHDFIHELSKRLKSLSVTTPVSSIYTFMPSYAKRMVLEAFPSRLSRRIHMVFEGNFYHEHPVTLLKRIVDAVQKNTVHREPLGQAKKILEISERARMMARYRR